MYITISCRLYWLKGRVCFCVHYRGPEDSLYHNKLLLKEIKDVLE